MKFVNNIESEHDVTGYDVGELVTGHDDQHDDHFVGILLQLDTLKFGVAVLGVKPLEIDPERAYPAFWHGKGEVITESNLVTLIEKHNLKLIPNAVLTLSQE